MARAVPLLVVILALATATAVAQPSAGGLEFQVNTFEIFSQFDPDAVVLPNGDFVIVFTDIVRDGAGAGIYARRFDGAGSPLDPNAFLVNVHTLGAQGTPGVAANLAGDFVIVWTSYDGQDGEDGGIFGRLFDSTGAPLTGDFQVNGYTTGHQGNPSVSMHPDGRFVVVWTSVGQDGDSGGIFGRRMARTGLPRGPEFRVNVVTTDQQKQPAVAMDGQGGFVAIWNGYYQDGSGPGIVGRRFDSSGSPLTGEFQVNEFTNGLQKYPRIAMHSTGEFVVVWSSFGSDGSGYGASARRFHKSTAPAGSEFLANTYTTGWQRNPDVSMDAAGNAVVVWEDTARDGDDSGLFAGILDAGGTPAGGDFQVNTYTTGNQFYGAVALAAGGDFVVAWQSYGQDSSAHGIFAQRYAAPGPCGLLDADADGLGDECDVALLSPIAGEGLDCVHPKSGRPRIVWNKGNYDRFRVQIAWDPTFAKGLRVTSGIDLLTGSSWRPSTEQWRRICMNAAPDIFVRVFGIDRGLDVMDPDRETFSDVIQAVSVN